VPATHFAELGARVVAQVSVSRPPVPTTKLIGPIESAVPLELWGLNRS
jgi:hypothetical protein